MATIRRWKTWFKMFFGKSELHVNQPLGQFIGKGSIAGYYNDLSQKVLCDKKHKDIVDFIPIFTSDEGKKVHFPIQIAQYGLGCYELFLKTKNEIYEKKAIACANYLLTTVEDDGGIKCMFFVKGLSNPYSAMCQGECISLFIRAYISTKNTRFLEAADKTFSFMINTNNKLMDNQYCFYEYPDKKMVLNGHIFALFGVFDYFLQTGSEAAKNIFDNSITFLENTLPLFENNKWTLYDLDGNIASLFYHRLHIEQLKALNIISSADFSDYISRWTYSANDRKLRRKMFWAKAKQKLRRNKK